MPAAGSGGLRDEAAAACAGGDLQTPPVYPETHLRLRQVDEVVLGKLREQLAQNDFGVLATFKGIAPALLAALPEGRYRVLERAVTTLDFESALEALDGLPAQASGQRA